MKRSASVTTGTPVNAVNATKVLTIAGVVVHGETVTINNLHHPETVNVYEFFGNAGLAAAVHSNIAVDVSTHMTKSSGTLTLPTQPTADDTMTIGEKEYTFIANDGDRDDGLIRVGTNLAGAKLNIVAAINGTDTFNTAHPLVTASAFAGNDCTLTALIAGVVGDAIATTTDFTAVDNVFAAVTLGSGADCSAANAAEHLIAAINANDTQGVAAVTGGSGVVNLSADVAGAGGNNISLAKVMAHGTFAGGVTKMSGGVDGTEAGEYEFFVDSTYLYVTADKNTKSGKNWRRITLGTAY